MDGCQTRRLQEKEWCTDLRRRTREVVVADFPKPREGPRSRVGPQLQSAAEVLASL